MNKTIIVVPSHRGLAHAPTKECIRNLVSLGAELRVGTGLADLAGGRSWLLSKALHAAREQGRDTILCIDDDMVFTVADANQVVDYTRTHHRAAAAMYPTAEGKLAATRYREGTFKVGLGFCAIPVSELERIAAAAPAVSYAENAMIWPFCESRAHYDLDPPEWIAEDYDLSMKLGGVKLLPIGVGHLKTVPLYADQETIVAIAEGKPLAKELPTVGRIIHRNDMATV